jgi:Ca-activated chloride channel family protein
MSFAYPWLLPLGLLAVVLTTWLLRRAEGARRAALAAFGEVEVLRRSSTLVPPGQARTSARLRIAVLGLGLLALARPQLGERESEMVRTGRDVLLLLDLSRSMGVSDIGETRLAVAKEHVWEVLSAYPSDRVGLVVFGGSAFLQMPFTSDRASLRLFLDSASPDDLGDPATDISAALLTALSAFEHEGEEGRRAVLIASDGESGEGDLKAAIEALRDEDLPVFAIGVGTTGGGPVPADSSEAPEPYHRDHLGRVIVSRLEEDELKTVAAATGGAYARGDRPEELRALVAALARVQPRVLAARKTRELADRYQWPLALMVVLLVWAELSSRAQRGILPAQTRSLAALGMTGLFLLSCSPVHRGERLYHEARYPEAYDVFHRGLERDSSARLAFDAGAALYRLERYDEAVAAFRRAARTPELRQPSLYNLGNALVRAAEERPGEAAPLLDAVGAYEEALRLAPADAGARWNLEVALRRLGDDRTGGGSPGRGRNADYGRGDNNVPGYEGNPDAAVGAMAGGGYGSAEGESAEELTVDEARRLLEAVERQQLTAHEGRRSSRGPTGDRDW